MLVFVVCILDVPSGGCMCGGIDGRLEEKTESVPSLQEGTFFNEI